MPPEAATFRDSPEGWTVRDEIAAAQVEVLDLWGRRWLMAQGVKQGKLPDAVEIPRPADVEARKQRKKVITDTAEIHRWFAEHGT